MGGKAGGEGGCWKAITAAREEGSRCTWGNNAGGDPTLPLDSPSRLDLLHVERTVAVDLALGGQRRGRWQRLRPPLRVLPRLRGRGAAVALRVPQEGGYGGMNYRVPVGEMLTQTLVVVACCPHGTITLSLLIATWGREGGVWLPPPDPRICAHSQCLFCSAHAHALQVW